MYNSSWWGSLTRVIVFTVARSKHFTNTWTYMSILGHLIYMSILGHTWVYMNIHKWTSTNISIHEHTWVYLNIHKWTWTYMSIHGHTWVYMDIHEYTRTYMSEHGHTWVYMDIHEYTWTYMRHYSWYQDIMGPTLTGCPPFYYYSLH